MWKGRTDSDRKERFHQCVRTVSIDEIPDDNKKKAAFIGFASDEGIKRNLGRQGARTGPQEIRNALGSLPYFQQGLVIYEIGDILCEEGQLEKAQQKLADSVAELLKKNVFPIVLGGGHEVAWGHYKGLYQAQPSEQVAIVNFDAHLDMRPYTEQGSSGTPFLQISDLLKNNNLPFNYTCIGLQPSGNTASLLETAKCHSVRTIAAEEIHLTGIESTFHHLESLLSDSSSVYVTVCLDVFASPYAPGVSAPQPLGLTPWQLIPLLRYLAGSGKVISLDIAELSPPNDTGGITAKLAGNLIFDFTHHLRL